MSGNALGNAVAAALTGAFLVAIPLTGRTGWLAWAAASVVGMVAGIVVAALARPPSGARGWAALLALLVPALALSALHTGVGFSYFLGHLLGVIAGRLRYPVPRG